MPKVVFPKELRAICACKIKAPAAIAGAFVCLYFQCNELRELTGNFPEKSSVAVSNWDLVMQAELR